MGIQSLANGRPRRPGRNRPRRAWALQDLQEAGPASRCQWPPLGTSVVMETMEWPMVKVHRIRVQIIAPNSRLTRGGLQPSNITGAINLFKDLVGLAAPLAHAFA